MPTSLIGPREMEPRGGGAERETGMVAKKVLTTASVSTTIVRWGKATVRLVGRLVVPVTLRAWAGLEVRGVSWRRVVVAERGCRMTRWSHPVLRRPKKLA